jgi:hypothetical protein
MKGLKFLILFSILGFAFQSRAQYLDGAEVYYDLIGNNKYLVTANVYRYCGGSPLNNLKGYVIADTFKIPINFKRTLIQKINDTCGNPCNTQNAKSNPGYERHTFVDSVDLNSRPYDSIVKAGLCTVKFAIIARRFPLITTHDSGTGVFYLDAQVNICKKLKSIHSPRFSYDPRFSSLINVPMYYNPGPLDTLDYDSLSFELDVPLLDVNKLVTYKTYSDSYTKDIPMATYCPPNPGVMNCRAIPSNFPPRGFYFDVEKCQFILMPSTTNNIETANLKIKVKEWRRDSSGKFQLLGYVCRENKHNQIFNNQYPPYANFGSYSNYFVCNGTKKCFSSFIKDDPYYNNPTILDTVHFDWNHGIPSASFEVSNPNDREKTAVFCWTPKANQPKHRYLFASAAWDKKCNYSISTFGYSVQTYPQTEYQKTTSVNSCNSVKMKAWVSSNNEKLYGTLSLLDSNNQIIYITGNQSDSFTLNKNGTYYIRYSFSKYANKICTVAAIDTIQISNALYKGFEFKTIDTTVCPSYLSKLSFSPSSYKQSLSWTWYRNDTLLNTIDTFVNEVISKNTKYRLVLMDTKNCSSIAERNYKVQTLVSNLLPVSTSVCPNTKVALTPNISTLKTPIQLQWVYNGNTISTDTLTFLPKEGETIKVSALDKNACLVSDSVLYHLYPAVSFTLSSDVNTICKDSLALINSNNVVAVSPYNSAWKVNGYDSLSFKNKGIFKFKIIENSRVSLKITDKNLCSFTDSLDVLNLGHPKISLLDSGSHCAGDILKLKATTDINDGQEEWTWKIDKYTVPVKTTFIQISKNNDFQVILNLKHRYSCNFSDTFDVKLFPIPNFYILSDTLYNRFAFIKMQVDNNYENYLWSNGVKTQDNQFWAASLGASGTYYIWCKVTDSNSCSNEIHKTIKTVDLPSGLNELSSRKINLQPNPFTDKIKIISDENTHCVLMELSGKIILETNLLKGSNELNTESLAKGMYLIKVGEKVELVVKE